MVKVKIECEIEVPDTWYDKNCEESIEFFYEEMNNGNTVVILRNNDSREKIGATKLFKWEIKE